LGVMALVIQAGCTKDQLCLALLHNRHIRSIVEHLD
jgi:hypothetical protein